MAAELEGGPANELRIKPGMLWWWRNSIDAGKKKQHNFIKARYTCGPFSTPNGVWFPSILSLPAEPPSYPQYIISSIKFKYVFTVYDACTIWTHVCPWSNWPALWVTEPQIHTYTHKCRHRTQGTAETNDTFCISRIIPATSASMIHKDQLPSSPCTLTGVR